MSTANRLEVRKEQADGPLAAEVVRQWHELASRSADINRLFASPDWFAFLATQHERRNLFLWSGWHGSGRLAGVIPVLVKKYTLKFDVAAGSLAKVDFRCAHILGSQFLLPDDEASYQTVFNEISHALPEVEMFYFDSVPVDGFLYNYLENIGKRQPGYFTYTPDGRTPYHYLELPGGFDQYLASFKRKKRYNLQRQVRKLQEAASGKLTLKVITAREDVRTFLEQATAVSRNSWQHERIGRRVSADETAVNRFEELAKRGLLRCYLLETGDAPCAFVMGYQFAGVYHYNEIGYDRAYAEYSPGTVLLYLVVRDLAENSTLTRLNFGKGDAAYKQQFGSGWYYDVSACLFRNTLKNRMTAQAHQLFRSSVKFAKKYIRSHR